MRPPNRLLGGEPEYIYDAGKHKHKVEGVDYFRIETWVEGVASRSLTIPCAYIPSIPSTLVNFRLAKGAIMYGEIANLVTEEAIGTLIVGSPDKYVIHKIPLKLKGQRVYASNLVSCEKIRTGIYHRWLPTMIRLQLFRMRLLGCCGIRVSDI